MAQLQRAKTYWLETQKLLTNNLTREFEAESKKIMGLDHAYERVLH